VTDTPSSITANTACQALFGPTHLPTHTARRFPAHAGLTNRRQHAHLIFTIRASVAGLIWC
jgi:hypothetical protein